MDYFRFLTIGTFYGKNVTLFLFLFLSLSFHLFSSSYHCNHLKTRREERDRTKGIETVWCFLPVFPASNGIIFSTQILSSFNSYFLFEDFSSFFISCTSIFFSFFLFFLSMFHILLPIIQIFLFLHFYIISFLFLSFVNYFSKKVFHFFSSSSLDIIHENFTFKDLKALFIRFDDFYDTSFHSFSKPLYDHVNPISSIPPRVLYSFYHNYFCHFFTLFS